MRRKPTNGARSKLVFDVPAELDTILKHRGRGTASPLLADRLVFRSAVTAGDAEALGRGTASVPGTVIPPIVIPPHLQRLHSAHLVFSGRERADSTASRTNRV